jgi:cytochrome c biogenesis protein ResB
VFDNGKPVETKDIRVNDFLGYKDVDFYQQDYGWAPHLVVRNPQGQVVFDSPVQLFGEDKSQESGVVKVPDFGYNIGSAREQLGANLVMYPDARSVTKLNPDGSVSSEPQAGPGGQEARNPVLLVNLFVGDLGLNAGAAQNVNTLDTAKMQPYFADGRALPLGLGQQVQLPLVGTDCSDAVKAGCFTLQFSELKQYSLFHVKKDNGVPFIYISFGLIMTGLLTKLYMRPLLEARARRRRTATEPDYAWLASIAGESAEERSASIGGR